MKNLWPEKFEENNKPSAKNIIEEQAKLLPKLTGGIVYAEVAPLSEMDAMSNSMGNDFSFRFDLRGKFLENYYFNVCMFSHDITLYPVKFRIDEKVASELSVKKTPLYGHVATVDTPEQLEQLLARVLTSERIKSVVGSIIRLSK